MSKELPPSRTAEQFVVRFPDGMRDRIAEAAKNNKRSMNAEIIARLESSLSSEKAPDPDQLQQITEDVTGRVTVIIEKSVHAGIEQAIGRAMREYLKDSPVRQSIEKHLDKEIQKHREASPAKALQELEALSSDIRQRGPKAELKRAQK